MFVGVGTWYVCFDGHLRVHREILMTKQSNDGQQVAALELEMRLQAERKAAAKAEGAQLAKEMQAREETVRAAEAAARRAAKERAREHARLLEEQRRQQEWAKRLAAAGVQQREEMALSAPLFRAIGYMAPVMIATAPTAATTATTGKPQDGKGAAAAAMPVGA